MTMRVKWGERRVPAPPSLTAITILKFLEGWVLGERPRCLCHGDDALSTFRQRHPAFRAERCRHAPGWARLGFIDENAITGGDTGADQFVTVLKPDSQWIPLAAIFQPGPVNRQPVFHR